MSARFSIVQTTDLSPATSVTSVNLASLPPGTALGQQFENDGKIYKWVQVDTGTGPVAIVAGGAAMYTGATNDVVTMDSTDAVSANSVAGGFLTGAVTDTYYTVIQVGGVQTGVKVDAGTAIGECLSQGTDGELVSTTVGTAAVNLPVAVAITAASGGTATVKWNKGNL